ncbi:MAG: hypothetical protein P8J33_04150 [Pirellulaceae bacterium]|nr:hypothetical protein [Pirellulaceae bacterium]
MMRKEILARHGSRLPGDETQTPTLTIFAVPKAFEGHTGVIQRNAIRSWAALKPYVEVLLFGSPDDPDLQAIADEIDAPVIGLKENNQGTPILDHVFAQAHSLSRGTCLCYVNSDIIVGPEVLDVVDGLTESELVSFLAIGQRTDLQIDYEISFENKTAVSRLNVRRNQEGQLDSVVCKDYFLFSNDLFRSIPGFLVGRGNWDNWMVATTKAAGVPVVDVTEVFPTIHQRHTHSHVAGGRKNAYVFGAEARENQRLAGGRHLVKGSTATWCLTREGLKKRTFPLISMIRDMPKFASLLTNLMR